MSKPNCLTNCGSVTILFPFGMTEDCSLDASFLVSCNRTSSSSHTLFLPQTNLSVLNISLNGELQISWPVASYCYAERRKLVSQTFQDLNLTTFQLSSNRNKFTVTTGCVSLCNRLQDIETNGSCSGTGCCTYGSGSVFNHTTVVDFNPCGHAFLVERGAYNFDKTKFPVGVDWVVKNQTCQEAMKENSEYYHSLEGSGYLCNCTSGFEGNPYLLHGCQDVDIYDSL